MAYVTDASLGLKVDMYPIIKIRTGSLGVVSVRALVKDPLYYFDADGGGSQQTSE